MVYWRGSFLLGFVELELVGEVFGIGVVGCEAGENRMAGGEKVSVYV